MTRVVSIGECMIELSGREGVTWRQGYAGDTLNTLWYLRALAAGIDGDRLRFRLRRRSVLARANRFPARQWHRRRRQPDDPRPGARPLRHHAGRAWRALLHLLAAEFAAARCLADDHDALAESLNGRRADLLSPASRSLSSTSADATTCCPSSRSARAGDTVVAFDPNYRPRLWAGSGQRPQCHARGLCGRLHRSADVRRRAGPVRRYRPRWKPWSAFAITGRARSSSSRVAQTRSWRSTWRSRRSRPRKTIEPLDTTGAGDSFNGAIFLRGVGSRPPTPSPENQARR
jgi:2-dehydro-3-deoxygluconokinase